MEKHERGMGRFGPADNGRRETKIEWKMNLNAKTSIQIVVFFIIMVKGKGMMMHFNISDRKKMIIHP